MLRTNHRAAFTLLEIMIVVAIMGIVLTIGVPSFYRALSKNDLARAVNDTIEGCKTARDGAILQGIPYEFVVKENGELNVVPMPGREQRTEESPGGEKKDTYSSPYAAFPRQLGEDVMVQLVGVNFVELMNAPEARVRFFPNGTSDEFTIIYNWKGDQRTIQLDVVTGMPEEVIRE